MLYLESCTRLIRRSILRSFISDFYIFFHVTYYWHLHGQIEFNLEDLLYVFDLTFSFISLTF